MKFSFISCPDHIPEMIIFVLSIVVGIVDPEIYGNYRCTVSPNRRDQIDPLNNPMVFAAPVPGHQFNLMRIGLVEGTIIDYKDTFVSTNQPFRFVIKRLRVVRLSL